MQLVTVILAALSATIAQPAEPEEDMMPKPVEVMVLGTYHFANPGLDVVNVDAADVLTAERQAELEALADVLAAWRPTKIMVERQAPAPFHDTKYETFEPADLAETRNERVQIGYRLAHRLGHPHVYAIDEQPGEGEPDYFPFGDLIAWAEANGRKADLDAMIARVRKAVGKQDTSSILRALVEQNADPRNHISYLYYEVLDFSDGEAQPGAVLNAMWYMRNAKIFAKLAQAAEPGDRVVVIYGAGHNYWLRHFVRETAGYESVDPVPYLEAAIAGVRE